MLKVDNKVKAPITKARFHAKVRICYNFEPRGQYIIRQYVDKEVEFQIAQQEKQNIQPIPIITESV